MNKEYSRLVTKISALMMIHFCLWFSLSVVYAMVCNSFFAGLSPAVCEIATDLLYAVIYLITFGTPILLFKRFTRSSFEEKLNRTPGKDAVLVIFVSVAAIYAASVFGTIFTAPFDAIGFDVFDADVGMTVTPATVFLKLVMMVVIPAILEETLFRGLIMRSLAPYGKTQAIMLSALLFALMHQNPKQFLYAFAGGIVIGYFVLERGSLLLGMLIHGINNLVSLISLVVYNSCTENVYIAFSASLQFVVFCGALVALPMLIIGAKKKEAKKKEEAAKCNPFTSPLLIVYFLISILYVVYIIVLSRAGI